jgi:small GTP-binding protein
LELRFNDLILCADSGDTSCGKTALLITYATKRYQEGFLPTVFDNFETTVEVDGKPVRLGLWDTAGQEKYDQLRPLSYLAADVMIICFRLSQRESFESIRAKWFPEVVYHAPGIPIIVAGLGLHEWGETRNASFVSRAEGEALKEQIGVSKPPATSSFLSVD